MKSARAARTLVAIAAIASTAVASAVLSSYMSGQHMQLPGAVAAMLGSERPVAVRARRDVSPRAAPASASAAGVVHRSAREASAGETKAGSGMTPRERLVSLRPPLSLESASDPFGVLSWLPPPPPPPPPAPSAPVQEAAPVAPPLPFAYVGTFNADAVKPQVFLSSGERLLIVSPGDVIDARYRLESITDATAVFTYLPLNEKQIMSLQGEGK